MPETDLPQNMSQLLAEISQEWSALLELVDKLAPEQMLRLDTGGWSPKDNLAHLSEWMKILLGYHLDRRPPYEVMGVAPEVTRDWDMDGINKVLLERNRSRSSGEVLDELKQVYARVTARLKAMPFNELMKARFEDDPERQPLLNWVLGNTSAHIKEHRLNILKSLQG